MDVLGAGWVVPAPQCEMLLRSPLKAEINVRNRPRVSMSDQSVISVDTESSMGRYASVQLYP